MSKLFHVRFLILTICAIQMTFSQQNYEASWLSINQLEIEGKVTTALGEVKTLLKKAKANNNHEQRLKALLFQWKFQQIIDEKSQVAILESLHQEIEQAVFPTKNILYMYLASFLESHYNDSYWRISQRTTTEDAALKDYRTWDAKTYAKQIAGFYKKALETSTLLTSKPVGDFSDLLVTVPISRKYKPTLYDVIAHKALAFFKNSKNNLQPKEAFIVNDANYFEIPKDFYNTPITTLDEDSFLYQSLKIYQELERIHSQRKNKEAFIYNILERFNFVKTHWKGGNTDNTYFKHIQKLQKVYKNHTIDLALAEAYRTLAFQKNADGKFKHPNFNNKALTLISSIEKNAKNIPTLIKAKNLKQQILQKQLSWQTESMYLPNQKHLAKLTFTNVRKAIVSVYKIPFEFNPNDLKPFHEKDSLLKAYLQKQPLIKKEIFELPKKLDHNTYSTEVIIPALPLGHYIFTTVADDNDTSWKYHQQAVSEIGFNKTPLNHQTRYQIVNRYTGKPFSNTKVTLRSRNRYDRNNDWQSISKITDAYGYIENTNSERRNEYEIVVQLLNDSLKITDNSYYYPRNTKQLIDRKKLQSKVLLFLDRSIYRPSQKVYFKAIAVQKEEGISSCIPTTKIEIKATDVNGLPIFKKILTTNEYGSIHGDFNLPKTGLGGNFNISASIINPKNKNRNQIGYVNFSVEEYKRPTFEVTFEPATKIFKLNGTVSIKGKANAFFGGNITNAKVTYSVKRTVKPFYWWWRSTPSNESGKQIDTGELVTDNSGNFTIEFIAKTDSPDVENNIFNYEITAKVSDINGETHEASQTIKVADKNLLTSIEVDAILESKNPTEIIIKTTDVNANPIHTNGTLTIYKLKAPSRFLNTRPWPIPDIQQIEKTTFEKAFPHHPYTDENDPETWKKGATFCEHSFKNTSHTKVLLDDMKTWPAGKYILVTKVNDPLTKSTTENKKIVTLNHTEQKITADKQLFDFSIDYDSKNANKAHFTFRTATDQLYSFLEIYDGDRLVHKEQVIVSKGAEERTIMLPKLNYKRITAKVHYHIFNTFYSQQKMLDFSDLPVNLEIEKAHFTNKLIPGGKETWSFKLKSSDNKKFEAEGLASMYDASLDQFRSHSWNTNFTFYDPQPQSPFTQELNKLSSTHTYYNELIQRIPEQNFPLEKVNLFGFTFNKINSWKYRQYLNELKYKIGIDKITAEKLENGALLYGIINGDGYALPGVSISILDKNAGTITDFDGLFSLHCQIGDIVRFEYVGFKSQTILIDSKKQNVNISLVKDLQSLNEVVVIGYGSQKKSKTRSNGIQSRSMKNSREMLASSDLESDVVLEETVQGKIAGISVVENEPTETKTKERISSLKSIKARTNLNETAFFIPNLKTNNKGEIEFEFTSPEALTQWNLQLLAHTKNATWGKLTAETLTQKDLNIIPNAPRFLREGDQLLFSAKISNLSNKALNGTALLEWTNPIDGKALNQQLKQKNETQNFSVAANGNTEVAWKLDIPVGLGAIQYKIVAKAGNATDGQTAVIPVLTNRKLVTESIAMWVSPGDTQTYTLNNFDLSSSTQKPHQITLEYTSNPAWLAIKSLPYLMEFPHECSEQTFSRLYANSIATHIINSQPNIKKVFESWEAKGSLESPLEKNEVLKQVLISESPWLRAAQSESEQQKRLAELFEINKMSRANERAINKLKQLQKSNGGFPWFNGGRENRYITRHIVSGFGHLKKLGVLEQRTKTDRILNKAIHFLDKEWIKDFEVYKNRNKDFSNFYKNTALLHFAYARSYHLDRFPMTGTIKEIVAKALKYQSDNWQQCSLFEKGLLALTLHRFKANIETTNIIVTSLVETAVQSKANGMYWKENKAGWYWHQSIISTQALLIEVFSETNQPQKYIEGLKLFLLKNKRTNRWDNTISTANACYALLLNKNDWLKNTLAPKGEIFDKKNSIQALSTAEAGTGYFKTHWNANEIDESLKTIEVTNTGKVTNYGGYYWQYFENLDKIKIDDRGPLAIDKELYLKTTTNKGTSLKKITTDTPLKRGDKVSVRLLIKSESQLEYVHLKDMRASGFEPTKVLSGYEYKDKLWYYQNTKDVATHFFIDRMPKGNYVLEYDVIANQTGTFSNGITTLQCMYAPEFSSHSSGQRVEIK